MQKTLWSATLCMAPLTTLTPLVASAQDAVELAPVTVSAQRDQPDGVPSAGSLTLRQRSEVETTINAVDSEDALKYLPSLMVRKRFAGDYDHAVLSSRSSGSGNSARSLVFVDGMLLSNLLGNGVNYTPRWGMISADAIDETQVDYGPFHAAWSGNALGAVVRYRTRMPKAFTSHAQARVWHQPWHLLGDDGDYTSGQAVVGLGNRHGTLAWTAGLTLLDSNSQPLGYATRLVQSGVPDTGGTAVSGAIAGRNPRGQDWLLLGSTGQTHSRQQQLRVRMTWDFDPEWRLAWTGGLWHNDAERQASSWLRDDNGNAVVGGPVTIDGRRYTLTAADFANGLQTQQHTMQGLQVQRHGASGINWDFGVSHYRYASDETRSPTTLAQSGPGRVTDMSGSGWLTLQAGGHVRDARQHLQFGWQYARYRLQSAQRATAADGDWREAAGNSLFALSSGTTELQALFVQEQWQLNPLWRLSGGLRLEQWLAHDGLTASGGSAVVAHGTQRDEWHVSPKLGLAWQATPRLGVRLASGRAVRMPTAAELFQGTVVADAAAPGGWQLINSDPTLRPEKAWSTELAADQQLDSGLLRVSLFHEITRDALYSQRIAGSSDPNAPSTVQNIDKVRTWGVELVHRVVDIGLDGLAVDSSVTWTDSEIVANSGMPGSVGKRQPRVPALRASLLAQWAINEQWSWTVAGRYSGRQYSQLDNSDTNAGTWTGFDAWVTGDTRVVYRYGNGWTAAAGIDNVGNARYWAFHPYPQRTWLLELNYAP